MILGFHLVDVDPELAQSFVPKSEYDALKARYDAVVGSSTAGGSLKRARTARQSTVHGERRERSRDAESATPCEEKVGGRKKRSMKLEVGSEVATSLYPVPSSLLLDLSGIA